MVSGVKLASHADSSSGMLTDVIMCTYELIDKCTKEIEKKDKQMRDQALALIIKEAKKSVFDGWTDWRYNLLKSGICAQAKDRREYKKITKNIAQLIKWKGNDTAKSLIEELMQRYPRKPALLDELEKVEKKL